MALEYSSEGRTTPLGRGWQLTDDYIRRSLRRGVPKYEGPGGVKDEDEFEFRIGSSSGILVYMGQENGQSLYRSKNEETFIRFYYGKNNISKTDTWTAYDQSGNMWLFGPYDRVYNQNSGKWYCYAWHVAQIVDPDGNRIIYRHEQPSPQNTIIHLTAIEYNHNGKGESMAKVEFKWEYKDAKQCRSISYKKGLPGFPTVLDEARLSEIKVTGYDENGKNPISRTYDLEYGPESVGGYFHENIAKITPQDLPSVEFEYYSTLLTGLTKATKIKPDVKAKSQKPDMKDWDCLFYARCEYVNAIIPGSVTYNTPNVPIKVASKVYPMSKLCDIDGDADLDMLVVDSYLDNKKLPFLVTHWYWRENRQGQWSADGYKPLKIPNIGDHMHTLRFEESGDLTKTWSWSRVKQDVLDINGDGMVDIVYVDSQNKIKVCLANGKKGSARGFHPPITWAKGTALCYRKETGMNSYEKTGLYDLNGDGLIDYVTVNAKEDGWDVYFNTGKKFSDTATSFELGKKAGDCITVSAGERVRETITDETGTMTLWFSWSYMSQSLRDINGDGILDLIGCYGETIPVKKGYLFGPKRFANKYVKVFYGTGNGFDFYNPLSLDKAVKTVGLRYSPLNQNMSYEINGFYDVNGDGLPDYVYLDDITLVNPTCIKVRFNTGNGFAEERTWLRFSQNNLFAKKEMFKALGVTDYRDEEYHRQYQAAMDYDGDGQVEIVSCYYNRAGMKNYDKTRKGEWNILATEPRPIHKLKEFTGGNGMVTTIHYNTTDKEPNSMHSIPFKLWVPTQVTRKDLGTDSQTTQLISSLHPLYDSEEREFRGFAEVVISEDNERFSTSRYYQGKFNSGRKYFSGVMGDGYYLRVDKTKYEEYPYYFNGKKISAWFRPVEVITEWYDNAFQEEPGRKVSMEYKYYETAKPNEIGLVSAVYNKGYDGDKQDDRIIEYDHWYVMGCTAQNKFRYLCRKKEETVKDNQGNIVSKKNWDYSTSGNLSAETVWRGPNFKSAESKYTYDNYGRLKTVEDPDGKIITNEYYGDGPYKKCEKNNLGHTVSYSDYHGLSGNPGKARGPQYVVKYGEKHYKCDETKYDLYGRPVEIWKGLDFGEDKTALVTKLDYYDEGKEDSPPHVIASHYPDPYDLMNIKNQAPMRTEYRYYDSRGKTVMEASSHPDGYAKQYYAYDRWGRLTKAWTPFIELSSGYRDPSDKYNYYRYKHDRLDRIVEIADPTYKKTVVKYSGTTVDIYDEMGHKTSYSLSAYDEILAVTRKAKNVDLTTEFAYDAAGRLRRVTDPDGGLYMYSHYADGTLYQATLASDESCVSTKYLIYPIVIESMIDNDNETREWRRFDARTIENLIAAGLVVNSDLFPNLGIPKYEDDESSFKYSFKQNIKPYFMGLPTRTWRYKRSPGGKIKEILKSDGSLLSFEYDKIGRLSKRCVSPAYGTPVNTNVQTDEFKYDENTKYIGYLTSVKSDRYNMEFHYDSQGNVTQKKLYDKDKKKELTWKKSYTALNEVKDIQYPSKSIVSLYYDVGGNVRLVKDYTGNVHIDMKYDADGKIRILDGWLESKKKLEFRREYEYDPIRRLNSIDSKINKQDWLVEYGYWENGNVKSMRSTAWFGYSPWVVDYIWKYDEADRLIEATVKGTNLPVGVYRYEYNDNNTLRSVTEEAMWPKTGAKKWDYEYTDVHNHTLKSLSVYGGKESYDYTYDGVGQRYIEEYTNGMKPSKYTKTSTWTGDGLLASMSQQGVFEISYEYDHDGNRWKRTTNTSKLNVFTLYLDDLAELKEEGKSSVLHEYLSVGGVTCTISDDGTAECYFKDRVNVCYVFKDDGTLLYGGTHSPYGQNIKLDGVSKYSKFDYNGKEKQPHGDLLYYGARYYDPISRQWISVDPLRMRGAGDAVLNPNNIQPYTYCSGSPVSYIDPDGNHPVATKVAEKIIEHALIHGATYAANKTKHYCLEGGLRIAGAISSFSLCALPVPLSCVVGLGFGGYETYEAGVAFNKCFSGIDNTVKLRLRVSPLFRPSCPENYDGRAYNETNCEQLEFQINVAKMALREEWEKVGYCSIAHNKKYEAEIRAIKSEHEVPGGPPYTMETRDPDWWWQCVPEDVYRWTDHPVKP